MAILSIDTCLGSIRVGTNLREHRLSCPQREVSHSGDLLEASLLGSSVSSARGFPSLILSYFSPYTAFPLPFPEGNGRFVLVSERRSRPVIYT